MRPAATIQSENCQNFVSASPLKNIGVFAVDSISFPLTPALSLGERENLLPGWKMTTAQIIFQRAKPALPAMGEERGEGDRSFLKRISG
jgi:hypothetical protein